jgi:hypothetical protein
MAEETSKASRSKSRSSEKNQEKLQMEAVIHMIDQVAGCLRRQSLLWRLIMRHYIW